MEYIEKVIALENSKRKVVRFLALARENVTANKMMDILRALGVTVQGGKPMSLPFTRALLDDLENDDFVLKSDAGYRVSEQYEDAVVRDLLASGGWSDYVRVLQAALPTREAWYYRPSSYERVMRDVKNALISQDEAAFKLGLEQAASFFSDRLNTDTYFHERYFTAKGLLKVLGMTVAMREMLISHYTRQHLVSSSNTTELYRTLTDPLFRDERLFAPLRTIIAIERADLKAATQYSKGITSDTSQQSLLAFIDFLTGDYAAAFARYELLLKHWRTVTRQRKGIPTTYETFFYPLLQIHFGDLREAENTITYWHKNSPSTLSNLLLAVLRWRQNRDGEAVLAFQNAALSTESSSFVRVWYTVLSIKLFPDHNTTRANLVFANVLAQKYEQNGYKWLTFEISTALAAVNDYHDQRKHNQKAIEGSAVLGIKPLFDLFPRIEAWERSLEALMAIPLKGAKANAANTPADTPATRLCWLIDFEREEIEPLEQKQGKKGWSSGRVVALKRLREGGVEHLTEQDREIVSAIRVEYSHYQAPLYLDWGKAAAAAVDHPLLFLKKNPAVSVQLVKEQLNLEVSRTKEGNYAIGFPFEVRDTDRIRVVKETNTRYRVYEVTKEHIAIGLMLGGERLVVPEVGKDRLLKAVEHLAGSVTVHSTLAEHTHDIPKVDPDHRIYALILPLGEGFKLELMVKPFGDVPPYFTPAKGAELVITEVVGQKMQTMRDFKQERKAVKAVIEACPTLIDTEQGYREWELTDHEACLNILLELEPLKKDGTVIVEWPKGEKLRLKSMVGMNKFNISVKSSGDWFAIDGSLHVSDDLVLSMKQLLEMAQKGNSAFIELSDGQYLAMTEQLRRRVLELAAMVDEQKDGSLRMHPLAASALSDFEAELGQLETDKKWKENIKRLRESEQILPLIPDGFTAELRPYQREGFTWLMQRAHWGVGACLADDMGLGKTVQALAMLTARAHLGPALVVAPVSVCRNWLAESAKFSPNLRIQLFGQTDRADAVKALVAGDILVTSYGLLQQEAEMLMGIRFATVILDEAQAIKNRDTKRSQAAMQLNADYRVLTTGTPIENHLGELWNLFNFTNQGLLGSLNRFNERFANPIEKYNDSNRREQLQKIIRPFVLRRRKSEVLKDLPAKTEIVLTVEQTPEERALYEALRRTALEKLEGSSAAAGEKQIQILAELTKLRLACCNPKLAAPDTNLPSSKLKLFGETVEELIENGHKALVFSQFVKHLALLQDYLQAKGIRYQYLDGSTPSKVRQERIDAFQGGEGDLFLISLKAGGTGLNLTAADYVLHMDPWWNPAVEDQASDRAHRIGQLRPVTVYRLVTENTIEEKIMLLHEQKRDLADSLLSGTDGSSRLSADELLELLRS